MHKTSFLCKKVVTRDAAIVKIKMNACCFSLLNFTLLLLALEMCEYATYNQMIEMQIIPHLNLII
jgi:hypothetical protein